jgi:hypothetical protein
MVCATGAVTEASTDGDGVHITGSATVVVGQVRVDTDVPMALDIAPGGAGEGWVAFQLTGVLDGKLGDQERGDGDYHPPTLDVVTGELVLNARAPSPTPSETSPTPTETSPTPTPTTPTPTQTTPTPTPTHTAPSPTQTQTSTYDPPPYTPPPYTPPSYVPPTYGATQAPAVPGWFSTARLVAILNDLGPTGVSLQDAFLQVVGPFPVAGLATWHDDWHAYRCCPVPHEHQGIDIFAARGTPVVATFDGTVTQKVVDPDWGGLGIEITDGGGTQYYYAHFDRFADGVALGDRVTQGEVIGYVGTSGNAPENAPHLHFEVQPGGIPVPPMPYLNQWLDQAEAEATLLVIERTGHAPSITASELAEGQGLAGDATDELVAYPDNNLGAPVFPTVTSGAAPTSLPVGVVVPGSASPNGDGDGDQAGDTALVFAVAGLAFVFLFLVSLRQRAVAHRSARVHRHHALRATAGAEEAEPVRIVTLPETVVVPAAGEAEPVRIETPAPEPEVPVPAEAPIPAAAATRAVEEEAVETRPDEPVVIVVLPEAVGPRAAAVSVPVGEGHATASSDALEPAPSGTRSNGGPAANAEGDGRANGRRKGRSNGSGNGRSNGNGRSKAAKGAGKANGSNGASERASSGVPDPAPDAPNGGRPAENDPIGAPGRD